jgi:hypothetical protein
MPSRFRWAKRRYFCSNSKNAGAQRPVDCRCSVPHHRLDRAGQPVYPGGRLADLGRYPDALPRRALPFFIAMVIWSLKDEDGLPGRFHRSFGFRAVLVSLCVCSMYTSIASAIAWSAECTEGSPVEYRKIMKSRFAEVDQHLRSYVRMMPRPNTIFAYFTLVLFWV